jgi:hypothetical protein
MQGQCRAETGEGQRRVWDCSTRPTWPWPLALPQYLACGLASSMHRHSNPRSTLRHTDLQASYLACNHNIALMLVRLLVVLVAVILIVTQEQVDAPSGHGALVRSHALPILERSLVMCHHSPSRRCNRGTVTMSAATCAPSDLQTLEFHNTPATGVD